MRLKQIIAFSVFILIGRTSSANLQGQAKIDSFLHELPLQKNDTNKASILHDVSNLYARFDPEKGIKYAKEEYAICSKLDWKLGVGRSYSVMALNFTRKSDYPQALDCYFKALAIFEKIENNYQITNCNIGIGDVYYQQGDYPKSLEYSFKALEMAERYSFPDLQSSVADNIGAVYGNQGDLKNALKYFQLSLTYSEKTGNKRGIASTTHNIGNIYAQQKNHIEALQYYFRALKINEETGNKHYKAINLGEIGTAYLDLASDPPKGSGLEMSPELRKAPYLPDGLIPKGRKQLLLKSAEYFKKAIETDKETQNAHHMGYCYTYLYTVDSLLGNYGEALQAFQQFIIIRDSIFKEDKKVEILKLGMQRKMDVDSLRAAQAKSVVELKYKQQRAYTYSGLTGILILAGFSVFIIKERKKSERLLLNILPAAVAQELKTKGKTSAKHYDNVTVLFTDFVNFTQASERMGAQALIDELHECFKAFDEITQKYNIEKIKTIGDAYLTVCGLPSPDPNHAINIVKAAKEINAFMDTRLARLGSERTFPIRIGIHSGSVVAGIVGVKKFAYDIWGDAVNTAARMEQHGEAGKINISETTYELVKDKFRCEFRGELQVKGKGVMKMYFVS